MKIQLNLCLEKKDKAFDTKEEMPSKYEFGKIHHLSKKVEEVHLPVGKITACRPFKPSTLVRQVYDTESGNFFIIESERPGSWDSIGVSIGEIKSIKKAILDLHADNNIGHIFVGQHMVKLEYSLFLSHVLTIIDEIHNYLVDVRFIFALEQRKLIKAQIGKGITWSDVGVTDRGTAFRIAEGQLFEKIIKKLDLEKIQNSFKFHD